jgi:cytochrome c553
MYSQEGLMRAVLAIMLLIAAFPSRAATVQERLAQCQACHGEQGQSTNPEVPSLGAQQQGFVLVQLYMFREHLRKVDLMNEVAKGMTDADLQDVSDAISKLPAPKPLAGATDPAEVARAQDMIAQNRCNSCHTSTFAGQDQIPRLAGQREDYLLKSLREYKSGARRAYEPAMSSVVEPLKDEDFVVLAAYLARLK